MLRFTISGPSGPEPEDVRARAARESQPERHHPGAVRRDLLPGRDEGVAKRRSSSGGSGRARSPVATSTPRDLEQVRRELLAEKHCPKVVMRVAVPAVEGARRRGLRHLRIPRGPGGAAGLDEPAGAPLSRAAPGGRGERGLPSPSRRDPPGSRQCKLCVAPVTATTCDARFPAPIFCPKHNMEQAREGHLADLTRGRALGGLPATPLPGQGWYAKPAVAYMLEKGIATWNDFVWSLDATAHVDQESVTQALQQIWPEGEELRTSNHQFDGSG